MCTCRSEVAYPCGIGLHSKAGPGSEMMQCRSIRLVCNLECQKQSHAFVAERLTIDRICLDVPLLLAVLHRTNRQFVPPVKSYFEVISLKAMDRASDDNAEQAQATGHMGSMVDTNVGNQHCVPICLQVNYLWIITTGTSEQAD